jgi:lactoylglutathione lyase
MARAPIPIRGLFETHLTVRDVGRSVGFYRDVVGCRSRSTCRSETPPSCGSAARSAMLGLWGIGSSVNSLTLHIASTSRSAIVLAAPERFARRE